MLLTRRWISTRRSLLRSIPIDSARATVLSSPNDYLNSILSLIDSSQHDITLSALYFGTGEPERRILAAVERALSDRGRPHLTCTFIIDYSRATRVPSNGGLGSLQNFQSLLRSFGKRARVLLYKMSGYNGILESLIPQQLSEILGVYHCKFCIFDSNVILTGANLSKEYLTNRQDRYMLIEHDTNHRTGAEEHPTSNRLHQFLKSFVRTLDPYCCNVTFDSGAAPNSGKNSLLISKPTIQSNLAKKSLSAELRALVDDVSQGRSDEMESTAVMTTLRPLVQHSMCGVRDESDNLLELLFSSSASNAESLDINSSESSPDLDMSASLHPSPPQVPRLTTHSSRNDLLNQSTSTNTPESIRQHSTRTDSCHRWNNMEWSRVVIASPYPSYLPSFTSSILSRFLSLPSTASPPVVNMVSSGLRSIDSAMMEDNGGHRDMSGRRASNSLKFIVSEERSHGFFNGGGVKCLIPKMHSYALQSVLLQSLKNIPLYQKQIITHQAASRLPRGPVYSNAETEGIMDLNRNVSVLQYYRPQWTFHVKGIWLFASRPAATNTPEPSTGSSCIVANPTHTHRRSLAATYIGSSNFGERSCVRDFELGFVLHTDCPSLTEQLIEECSRIEEHSSDFSVGVVDYCLESQRADWNIPLLTKLLRSYL